MVDEQRTTSAIDRDLSVSVNRRTWSHKKIAQLQASIANDTRHIDRLLAERMEAILQVPGDPAELPAS